MTAGSGGRLLVTCLLLAPLAAGCFGRSVTPRYYTLSSAAGPAAGAPLASRPDLGLVVGPIEFPRYLDRAEIVRRDGSHRLALSDASRWGGSLRTDMLRVVADDVGRLLGTARVVVYPNEPRFAADYRILLDVREFEGVAADRVALRARWTITAAEGGQALAVEEARIEQPLASATTEDLVAAQSAALGALTRQIAERLLALHGS
jgi:uncharacterized lipoprotein YmbA